MADRTHIVIIGAGTLGMCTAHELARRGMQVTVIDMSAIASGSSGRSVGVVGTQLTDYFDILLRKHALERFAEWEGLGLHFNRIGYLRLARTPQQMELFHQSVAMQAGFGLQARVYAADELQKLVPHMHVDDLAGGIFGPDNGFIDPHELCLLLAEQVKSQGGKVIQFDKVTDIDCKAGHLTVHTQKHAIDCDYVVNAAGAWAPAVAQAMGQELHVFGERHEAVNLHLSQPLDYVMPMIMDLVNGEGTGLNIRHEKPDELIAEVHASHSGTFEDPDRYNELCNDESKVHLAELIMERVPDLPEASLGRGWAGLYPVTRDGRPLVGCLDPDEPRLVTAAGAGGYGIQLAPVIGTIAADWVQHGESRVIPQASCLAPTPDRNVPMP